MLKDFSTTSLHHTNICIGNRAEIIQNIDDLITKLSKDVSHVERLVYEYDKFLIKDAHHIFSIHLHKTAKDAMQIICIAFNATNNESQNSLLKMLEEPRNNTYFFLIVPSKKIILETVLSRAQIFEYKNELTVSKQTETFIKSTCAQRLEEVKQMIDDLKNEKITKQSLIEFIEEIEKYVHEKGDMMLLKRIGDIKEYLKEQGASAKQLLEYVAVTL